MKNETKEEKEWNSFADISAVPYYVSNNINNT